MTPGLPAVSGREVVRALERAGFVMERIAGSHHIMAHPDDARRVLTVPVHGARDLKPGTLRGVVRQAGFSVEDEGPGISEARLDYIFDWLYPERPKGERFGQHSGLGLSISRQIVEALKGRISAENRRDEQGRVLGARFVVRLPKAAAA